MIITARRLLLLVGFCVSCVPSGAPELPAPASANSLGASDTAAVLAVAAQFGIPSPAHIGHPLSQYVGCPVVILESSVTVDGNRRSWVELWVRRKGRDTGGHRCQVSAPSGGRVEHRDRWVASSEERTERTVWRVHDGDWHVDIALGTDVSYDTATLIVQAVRRHTLVNEIPALLRRFMGDTLPVVDVGDIRAIEKSRESHVYKVKTGEVWGYVLDVSIDAGRVLVHNVGSWIS